MSDTGSDRGRAITTTDHEQNSGTPPGRIRKAIAVLALTTAALAPAAAVATAAAVHTPDGDSAAWAAGSNCPVWMCGTNHNEQAARDGGGDRV